MPPRPRAATTQRSTTRPVPRVAGMPVDVVTDAEIDLAIRRGIEALASQVNPKTYQLRGRRPAGRDNGAMETGLHALVTYALIQGGLAVNDPRLTRGSPAVRGMLE